MLKNILPEKIELARDSSVNLGAPLKWRGVTSHVPHPAAMLKTSWQSVFTASTRSLSKTLKSWLNIMDASIATQDFHELATSKASTFLAQERFSSIAQPKTGSSGDKFQKSHFSPSTPRFHWIGNVDRKTGKTAQNSHPSRDERPRWRALAGRAAVDAWHSETKTVF